MECLWGLFCHRRPYGDRDQPHLTIFYVHFGPHSRITRDHLPDTSLLGQSESVHKTFQKESLVSLIKGLPGHWLYSQKNHTNSERTLRT